MFLQVNVSWSLFLENNHIPYISLRNTDLHMYSLEHLLCYELFALEHVFLLWSVFVWSSISHMIFQFESLDMPLSVVSKPTCLDAFVWPTTSHMSWSLLDTPSTALASPTFTLFTVNIHQQSLKCHVHHVI